jgi:hypothetical protein
VGGGAGSNPPVGKYSKSIYNVEEKANVVGVGTDFKFKIFSGKLLDVAPTDIRRIYRLTIQALYVQ